MLFRRSYKLVNSDNFIEDVKKVSWEEVLRRNNPDEVLAKFDEILMPIIDKPFKKFNVKNVKTPWLDNEISIRNKEIKQRKQHL